MRDGAVSEEEVRRLGALHDEIADDHRKMAGETSGIVSQLHQTAASSHQHAGDFARRIADSGLDQGGVRFIGNQSQGAASASRQAAGLPVGEQYAGETNNGVVGPTSNPYQYGSSEMTARADQVNQSAYQLGKNGSSPDDHQALADEHNTIANLHQDRAESLREAAKDWAASGYKKDATEMEQAAAAHIEAAKAHDVAGIAHEAAGKNVNPTTVSAAQSAADAALDKSLTADKITSQHGLYLNTPDITKAANFPDARIPNNLDTSNSFTSMSKSLMDKARDIVDVHDKVVIGGAKPLTEEDYNNLAEIHEQLAKTHQNTALRLKSADPVRYIQAISAHGDAMGAHEDAAKTARMMGGVYDAHWDGHHGEVRQASWNNPLKVWRKAHRAFLMAQMAYNRTNFATGVVKSVGSEIILKGDLLGHVFHGNQYKEGITSVPEGVGGRTFNPDQAISQIGRGKILAVSGGRVNTIHDESGKKTIGIELPVSNGYKVRVYLHDSDTYTVQRVHRDNVKGEMSNVFADDLGERVYQAGMFRSDAFGAHKP
jgi:hypothetical protein